MGDGVEDAEVQALARLWCLKRWRHLAQKHRFPAVVILVDVGEKEMGKAPTKGNEVIKPEKEIGH